MLGTGHLQKSNYIRLQKVISIKQVNFSRQPRNHITFFWHYTSCTHQVDWY